MPYFFEKVPLTDDLTYIIRDFEVPYIDYPLHYHPFFEINHVISSYGTRYVGDRIDKFEEGDLILCAPNLPHQWKNDISFKNSKQTVKSVVIQFHDTFLGEQFINKSEMTLIKAMLKNSQRGIKFSAKTMKKIGPLMQDLLNLDGFEGVLGFLNVLHVLSYEKDFELLTSRAYTQPDKFKQDDRINQVFNYLTTNFGEKITLSHIAEKTKMSDTAFSHFFKKRTGKSFSAYLNEIRIGHSCKLLIETDFDVAQICYKSGYNNLSHFNRQFKLLKGITPVQFRNTFKSEIN